MIGEGILALLMLLNNFMHDFSAAGWIFGGIAIYRVLRNQPAQTQVDRSVTEVLKVMRGVMRFCLFGIVFFGIIRTVGYKTYEWSELAGDSQVTLLIVKHIFFTVIFIVGLVYYMKAGKRLQKVTDERE
jgi:putative copper export protein